MTEIEQRLLTSIAELLEQLVLELQNRTFPKMFINEDKLRVHKDLIHRLCLAKPGQIIPVSEEEMEFIKSPDFVSLNSLAFKVEANDDNK